MEFYKFLNDLNYWIIISEIFVWNKIRKFLRWNPNGEFSIFIFYYCYRFMKFQSCLKLTILNNYNSSTTQIVIFKFYSEFNHFFNSVGDHNRFWPKCFWTIWVWCWWCLMINSLIKDLNCLVWEIKYENWTVVFMHNLFQTHFQLK